MEENTLSKLDRILTPKNKQNRCISIKTFIIDDYLKTHLKLADTAINQLSYSQKIQLIIDVAIDNKRELDIMKSLTPQTKETRF